LHGYSLANPVVAVIWEQVLDEATSSTAVQGAANPAVSAILTQRRCWFHSRRSPIAPLL
jgi:hypothetical protein